MFARVTEFSRFARPLFFDVLRHPHQAISEIPNLPLKDCLKFGWACFFMATVATAGLQLTFLAQVFQQIADDPKSLDELSKIFGALNSGPVGDVLENLKVARVSSFTHLLLSPLSAWLFLYLISGAIFAVSKLLLFGKTLSNDHDYEQVIKIVSVGQAPLLFCFIPLVGPIIGNLWSVWFIAGALGSLFQVSKLARLGVVAFSFFFLFAIWNSTVSMLASSYCQQSSHERVETQK